MDSATFFLIIIVLVAVVLIGVGIYLILVLHETRTSLRRFNNILDHLDSVLDFLDNKVARGANSLLGLAGVAKEVLEFLREWRGDKRQEHGPPRSQY